MELIGRDHCSQVMSDPGKPPESFCTMAAFPRELPARPQSAECIGERLQFVNTGEQAATSVARVNGTPFASFSVRYE